MTEIIELPIEGLTQNPRKVYIYLPKSYTAEPDKRYPVLYMLDGHNLFKDEWATYGKCWGFESYADENNLDIIIVGADCNHTGNLRLHEYTPYAYTQNWFGPTEGLGSITADWYVDTLKKYMDETYRTLPQRETTAIGGSSMGGLMALYMVIHHNEIYSKAACLSSSFGMCKNELIQEIENLDLNPDTRIYMDHGSLEGRDKDGLAKSISCMLELSHACTQKGLSTYPRIVIDGTHSEASWEKQIPIFMDYLGENVWKK